MMRKKKKGPNQNRDGEQLSFLNDASELKYGEIIALQIIKI